MRIPYLAVLLAALLLGGTGTAPAATSLKKGVLTYEMNGKPGTLTVGPDVLKVQGSDLVYVELNGKRAKAMGKKDGALLFFNKAGACTAELPGGEGRNTTVVFASPKGDILAVDDGTSVLRTWIFYTYPSMERLKGSVDYLTINTRDLTWAGNDAVIVTTINDDGTRPRVRDTPGSRSVELYSIHSGEKTPLFTGTTLCDYTFQFFDGKTLRALKTCVKNAADWNPENDRDMGKLQTKEIVTRVLP